MVLTETIVDIFPLTFRPSHVIDKTSDIVWGCHHDFFNSWLCPFLPLVSLLIKVDAQGESCRIEAYNYTEWQAEEDEANRPQEDLQSMAVSAPCADCHTQSSAEDIHVIEGTYVSLYVPYVPGLEFSTGDPFLETLGLSLKFMLRYSSLPHMHQGHHKKRKPTSVCSRKGRAL